jgi:hypothetical protein
MSFPLKAKLFVAAVHVQCPRCKTLNPPGGSIGEQTDDGEGLAWMLGTPAPPFRAHRYFGTYAGQAIACMACGKDFRLPEELPRDVRTAPADR